MNNTAMILLTVRWTGAVLVDDWGRSVHCITSKECQCYSKFVIEIIVHFIFNC